jgi:hypothetical protein
MNNPILLYAGTLLLAFLIEAMVEYVFGTPMDKIAKLKPFKWLLMYISLGVGVGVAFWYSLDLVALVMEQEPTWVGIVFTGAGIGRGANWLNDLWQKYLFTKKPPIPWYDLDQPK